MTIPTLLLLSVLLLTCSHCQFIPFQTFSPTTDSICGLALSGDLSALFSVSTQPEYLVSVSFLSAGQYTPTNWVKQEGILECDPVAAEKEFMVNGKWIYAKGKLAYEARQRIEIGVVSAISRQTNTYVGGSGASISLWTLNQSSYDFNQTISLYRTLTSIVISSDGLFLAAGSSDSFTTYRRYPNQPSFRYWSEMPSYLPLKTSTKIRSLSDMSYVFAFGGNTVSIFRNINFNYDLPKIFTYNSTVLDLQADGDVAVLRTAGEVRVLERVLGQWNDTQVIAQKVDAVAVRGGVIVTAQAGVITVWRKAEQEVNK